MIHVKLAIQQITQFNYKSSRVGDLNLRRERRTYRPLFRLLIQLLMKRLFRNAALDPQLEIADHTTAPL